MLLIDPEKPMSHRLSRAFQSLASAPTSVSTQLALFWNTRHPSEDTVQRKVMRGQHWTRLAVTALMSQCHTSGKAPLGSPRSPTSGPASPEGCWYWRCHPH